ncbi:MAG: hypothetical protein QG588_330 [Candidatus Poribacteria bacterium]|nr:hypothetical protein [Candidatus Poribacteria bacterium]
MYKTELNLQFSLYKIYHYDLVVSSEIKFIDQLGTIHFFSHLV